jgi:Holliday junction resolvasome RuvABC endonuclease subunit
MSSTLPTPNERRVVALDLGTKCGFSVFVDGKLKRSGRFNFSPRKSGLRGERWTRFAIDVRALLAEHKPNVLAYERVRRHVGVGAAHVYGGFLAQIEEIEVTFFPLLVVPPIVLPVEVGEWKKGSVGKGNATKAEVMSWVRHTLRVKPKSEDEADAIAIGFYATNCNKHVAPSDE